MRFYGLALLASAAVLGACGGGEKQGCGHDEGSAGSGARRLPRSGRAGRRRGRSDCGDGRDGRRSR